jgi:hypothetical protein
MLLPTRLGCRRRRYNPTTCNVCHVDNAYCWRQRHTHSCYRMLPVPTTGVNDTLTHAIVCRQRLLLASPTYYLPMLCTTPFLSPPPAGSAPLAMPSWVHNRPTRPYTDFTWSFSHQRHRRPSLSELGRRQWPSTCQGPSPSALQAASPTGSSVLAATAA